MNFKKRRYKERTASIGNRFTKALSLAMAVAMVMVPAAAGAVGIEQYVYTASDENILIKGSVDTAYGVATVMILPDGVTPDSLTADIINSEKYVLKSVVADKDGLFTLSVTMPEWSDSSVYNVYISDGAGVVSETFTHFNNRMAGVVVTEINKAANAAAVSAILAADADELAISAENLAAYGDSYAAGLFNGRPAGGYTVDTIMLELNRILALCSISGSSAEDAEKLVAQYAAYFGFDYENDLKSAEQAVKDAVFATLTSADIKASSAEYVFYDSYMLAVINKSTSYMTVKNALAEYGDKIGLDLTKFNALTEYKQGEVAQAVMNASPADIAALKTAFDGGVADAGDDNSGSVGGSYTPSSGGSSGGGGGFGSNFTVDTQTAGNISDAAADITFDDVQNHWSKDVVKELASKGIVTGFEDGSFRPDANVTRAEFAKLIINALGIQVSVGSDFSDVSENDWFYPYVYAAKNASLINGYEGKFRPNDRITREECAAIIYRALVRDGRAPEGDYDFADGDHIADYAKDCVSALAAAGLVKGNGTGFAPKANTTRAEAASMIYNMLGYMERG